MDNLFDSMGKTFVQDVTEETIETQTKVNETEVEVIEKTTDEKEVIEPKTNDTIEVSTEITNDVSDQDKVLAQSLFALVGIEVDDESLKDTSIEGIAEIIKNHNTLKETQFKDFEDPEIQELAAWKKQGGDLESFKAAPKRIEYSKIEVSDTNLETAESLMLDILKDKGLDEDEAKEQIDFYKDRGTLVKNTKKELDRLDSLNATLVEDYKAEKLKEAKANEEAIIETWKKVTESIESSKIGNFEIPKNEKESFKKYILPDEKGFSKSFEKREKLTLEQHLLIDYLIFKDFKIEGSSGIDLKSKVIEHNNKIGLSKVISSNSSKDKEKVIKVTSIDDFFEKN